MIQVVVAMLFFGALVAPLAIMAVTISKNWQVIVNALTGGSEQEQAETRPSVRVRTVRAADLRPAQGCPQLMRVAA